MSRKFQFAPAVEALDDRSTPTALGNVNALLVGTLAAVPAAIPDAVPQAVADAAPPVDVGFSVETDIILLERVGTSDITGALNGVAPPISADLLTAPADFAALGLSSLNGVVPPIFTDAVAQPIDFSQIDTDQPQRVSGRVTSLYPVTAEDVYIGYLEVPHSNTGVGLDNNGITSGNVGLAADAIEADLGGAGLEV